MSMKHSGMMHFIVPIIKYIRCVERVNRNIATEAERLTVDRMHELNKWLRNKVFDI